MKVNTIKFQNMINKAYKGVSNNKLLPLTTLMNIDYDGKGVKIITSNDEGDYLYIKDDCAKGDTLYATVYADSFVKLINKITTEYVDLDVSDNVLHIKANGNYKIELPLDESGNIIEYPDPLDEFELNNTTTIKLSAIKTMIDVNKSALATSLETPVYTNYYMGDKVVTTDSYKICSTDLKLFDTPVLLSSNIIDLVNIITSEDIDVSIEDDIIVFVSSDCIVYGHIADGINEYAIDPITALVDTEILNVCEVKKSVILDTLDRLALFVSDYDNKAILLNFTDKGLEISSKQSNGIEVVGYTDDEEHDICECMVDIDALKEQIKVIPEDVVKIYYGNDKILKFSNNGITQVIALMN